MAVVDLRIEEPSNGANFVGNGPVPLRGAVLSTGHPPLFFKWYSSLVPPPTPDSRDASIPVPSGRDPLDFEPAAGLPLGSQVITLSAKDVAGETRTELESVQHAGMAGGPAAPGNPAPCIVHVFIATLTAPAAGAKLSKASSPLAAQAPLHWPDPAYQAINRLQYRWRFTPDGLPAGRASADLVPGFAQLAFDEKKLTVTYTGPLPNTLGTGNYTLILRVESKADPDGVGYAVSLPVLLEP